MNCNHVWNEIYAVQTIRINGITVIIMIMISLSDVLNMNELRKSITCVVHMRFGELFWEQRCFVWIFGLRRHFQLECDWRVAIKLNWSAIFEPRHNILEIRSIFDFERLFELGYDLQTRTSFSKKALFSKFDNIFWPYKPEGETCNFRFKMLLSNWKPLHESHTQTSPFSGKLCEYFSKNLIKLIV